MSRPVSRWIPGARVPSDALGPGRGHKRPESANRHLLSAWKGIGDLREHHVDRRLCGERGHKRLTPRCVSRGPIFSIDAFLTRRFRAAGCHHGDPARPLGRVLRDPQRHRHAIRAIPDRPEFASRSDPTLAPARRSDGRIRDRYRLHDRALSPSPEPAGLHTEGRGPPRAVEEVRREAGRGGHLAGATGTPRQPRAPVSWTGSESDQRSTHTTREEGIRKQRPTRGIRPHEHGEGPVALRTPPGERTATGRTPFTRNQKGEDH